LAAAKRDITIRQYVLDAIEERLLEDLAGGGEEVLALTGRGDPVLGSCGTTGKTQSMTACSRGDVVLVGFVFSDESGRKLRPAVIISSPVYHRAREEVIMAAITSNIRRHRFGDHPIADWKKAGLLFPSLATRILRTVKRTMIDRKLGSMPKPDLKAIERSLRRSLGL
jgi:mRNA interferase MazF